MKIQKRILVLNIVLIGIASVFQLIYATPPVQTPGLQFTAATIKDVPDLFRAQPNSTGWVGPTQYILVTNQSIRSFAIATGLPDGALDIDPATFLGTQATGDLCSLFDRWGQRWLILGTLGNFFDLAEIRPGVALAYSDGPIITKDTKWTVQNMLTGPFTDSPHIGVDQNAVYITTDIYGPPPTFSYFGVTLLEIPRSSFVAGNPFNFTSFPGLFNPAEFPVLLGLSQSQPPYNFDPNPEFGYIVISPGYQAPGFFTYTNYYMLRIVNPGSNSPSLSPSAATPISLAAPVFTDGTFIPNKGNLYGPNGLLQNNISNSLDTGGIHIRNHQLYFVTTGLVDNTGTGSLTGDRNAILWYQYDLTGGTGTETVSTVPVLVQSGVIFDSAAVNPKNYTNPAIMTNKNNDLVIIGNVAGNDDYINAFYTGRKASDPLGQLRDIILLTNNTVGYNYGTLDYNDPLLGQRWGDYCSLSPDPINDLNIYATSQIVPFANGWGILATQLIPVP